MLKIGQGSQSPLVQLVLEPDEDKRMPRSSPRLSGEKIALLKTWIDTGAKEGTRPDETTTVAVATPSRRVRKLDVLLATSASAPAKDTAGKLELSLPAGPLAPITAVAFSPDGKLLVVGSYGRVTVWDLATVQPTKVLTNVLGAVNDVRFSPDGKLLAVAGGQPSAKGDLRLYQVEDWKLAATLGGHEDVVFSIAFRPDGKQLASASFDKTVRLWNLAENKVEKTLTGHSDFVYSVGYSPDGQRLVSASKDRTVKLIEVATGKSLLTFSGMDQDVLAVAFSPDGKHVVSSGFESGIYWWDPKTGKREKVERGHSVAVHELCFSKDGKLLASAGGDKTVRLWNGEKGANMHSCNRLRDLCRGPQPCRDSDGNRQLRRPGATLGRDERQAPRDAAGATPRRRTSRLAGPHARRSLRRQPRTGSTREMAVGQKDDPICRCCQDIPAARVGRESASSRIRNDLDEVTNAPHIRVFPGLPCSLFVSLQCNVWPNVIPDDHARHPRGRAAGQVDGSARGRPDGFDRSTRRYSKGTD